MENLDDEKNINTIDDLISHKKINILRASQFSGNLRFSLLPPEKLVHKYFLTVNLCTKDKFTIGNLSKRWDAYMPSEQHRYLRLLEHLFIAEAEDYEIYFEYTRDVNLHLHSIVYFRGIAKELRILTKRFFKISDKNNVAVDVREVYDEDHLRSYLTEKEAKGYQTAPFPPIIKKPIECFN